jgi:outer membrane protein assembly factor BamB
MSRRLWVLGVVVALALAVSGCDWAMFGYGPTHTGFNPGESAIGVDNVASLTLLFTADAQIAVFNTEPSVVGGVAYLGSAPNNLYAFDAKGSMNCAGPPTTSCTPLWTDTTGGESAFGSAVVNGVAYVGSFDGKFYAFDAHGTTNCSGSPAVCSPLWTATTGGPIETAPTVANGTVYVPSDDGTLYAFDAAGNHNCSGTPKTCGPLWQAPTSGPIDSSPAVANGSVFVGASDGNLFAFDAAGKVGCSGFPKVCNPVRWYPAVPASTSAFFQSPSVVNGVLYDSDNKGTLYAFDATGKTNCPTDVYGTTHCAPLWTANIGGIVESPAVANGVVYVGDSNDDLYAFDAAGMTNCSGTPKVCTPLWTAATGGQIRSAPSIANGVVYVGSMDHSVYAFDAAGNTDCSGTPKMCTPLWSFATDDPIAASPVVVNGVVYAANFNRLYAFGLPPTTTTSTSTTTTTDTTTTTVEGGS